MNYKKQGHLLNKEMKRIEEERDKEAKAIADDAMREMGLSEWDDPDIGNK